MATAYALAFFHRVSLQSLNFGLTRDFGADAAGIAALASAYFWGYTLMQLPAGLLVDRYGVRRVVLCSMATSALGSAAFALSPNLSVAVLARLVLASGDALVFSSLLKLVALRFPDRRFGVMSGLSQVSGYVGGAFATVPLAVGVEHIGWRSCLLLAALIGALNFILIAASASVPRASGTARSLHALLTYMADALRSRANWGNVLTFGSHFVVVTTLSGVWGLPMIAHVFGIDGSQAGAALLAFMIGNAFGSGGLGYLADRVLNSDRALVVVCLLRSVLIALLFPAVLRHTPFALVVANFAVLGLLAGGTIPLILKCTKRLYTAEFIGVGASVNTASAGLFAAATQPVIGFAMTWASGGADRAPGALNDVGYGAMVAALLLLSVPGLIGPLMMGRRVRG
ncbi:MFS transporter [Methylobacterium sp. SyP6R]|uniref:MFS transporter n=1 Tax=Methylobacterium sp. SyP6R TaxID=2718876 RepID=UPI001F01F7D3|nr:MFS transporter [Methylobacterium sp. SyP6R]MCF4130073.1 MFS transporter [Methylobacterium sp. SyP6R]